MDRVDAVILAVMMNFVDFLGIGKNTVFAVAHHRVILPASLPKLINHLHVFVRDVVAQVMSCLRIEAGTPCGAVKITRDDIPSSASLGQMVECGHPASKLIWRLE